MIPVQTGCSDRRTRGWLMIVALALWGAACSGLAGAELRLPPLFQDDFTGRQSYELIGGRAWEFRDGGCRGRGGPSDLFAVAPLDELEQAVVEVTLTPEKRAAGSYITAGLALRRDPDNDWRLILVEAPEGRRYFELIERHQGLHQAQITPGPTQLAGASGGTLTGWDYGAAYHLTLELNRDGITGEVKDAATGRFWRRSFSFASARAVRRGRPALHTRGTDVVFRSLAVRGVRLPVMSGFAAQRGPVGSAAILIEKDNAQLRQLLEQSGFGVTTIRWDDLGKGRIPVEALDLLVLPDARRLPATAAGAVTAFLRAGGKLMAVGAPAFGELLVKSPDGWVSRERYDEVLLSRMKPQPIPFKPGAWKRSCRNPQKAASLTEDDGGLKIACDLDGWDGYAQAVEKFYGAGHDLFTFYARGDANTPQLALEFRERDGSRWIATVPLTAQWRPCLLRPGDFVHWHDSTARRGGAGDRFNPQNAQMLVMGLSSSHTPKAKPGPHTFWIRGIGTAPDPGGTEVDAHVPDIAGVCPSYALHPLPDNASLRASDDQRILPADWKLARAPQAYSPNWREGGRGIERDAAWRWLPVVDTFDAGGRNRGALVSLFVGHGQFPNAVWANVGVAEPNAALAGPLREALMATAKAMVRGCFLLEGGSKYFSYHNGEPVELGALVLNAGRQSRRLTVRIVAATRSGKTAFEQLQPLTLAAGERGRVGCTWTPKKFDPQGYTVRTELLEDGTPLDSIRHTLDHLEPAGKDFARVEGSHFKVGGETWFLKGINYWPNYQGGRATVPFLRREHYDPAVIERDLDWMESIGINFLTGIQQPGPADPSAPGAFRDLHDFLNRCQRHGMKVFYFLGNARPLADADFAKVQAHITAAGLKDHPAILAWELAWEPILYSAQQGEFLKPDWNAWIVERYGSVAHAEADWEFKLARDKEGRLLTPSQQLCATHGPQDRAVAAFRRFFSDRLSRGYREIISPLRAWDPKHLITFRFGACGIPDGGRFAHAHSVGVAKHVSFMCPEGYNLQTGGWGKPTPADDLRKGGLVTLYYRFVSREKPVVWMEFGYTVNGFHAAWQPPMTRIKPEELAWQKTEYENFYAMFLESGARGAAPWWLPGGFRLGEQSDFGVLEPDGSERPCVEVMRRAHPQFAQVQHPKPTRLLDWDPDAHNADAWQRYSQQYLEAIKAGQRPYFRTAGTGTDSASTPLIAVGNTPCNGHNPPKFLNAEFNTLEIRDATGAWRGAGGGAVINVKRGAPVRCRASVGNLGEAKWLAPRASLGKGGVFLAGRKEYGFEFKMPIAANTDYLADAVVQEFTLVTAAQDPLTVSFEMLAEGRTHFGERRTVTLKAVE